MSTTTQIVLVCGFFVFVLLLAVIGGLVQRGPAEAGRRKTREELEEEAVYDKGLARKKDELDLIERKIRILNTRGGKDDATTSV